MNFPTTCGNVLSNDAAKKTMESKRICFIKVIECLQYLAWQGLAMQGDTVDESNFIQLCAEYTDISNKERTINYLHSMGGRAVRSP